MAEKLKVVIDTNVIIRAVSGRSIANALFNSLFNQEFILCVSTEILLEYEEKLSQIFDEEIAELVISTLFLLPNLQLSTVYFDLRLIVADADDDKFVNCAFSSNSDYLVSDDKHFKALSTVAFPKISCLTYDQFMQLLRSVKLE